MRVIDSHTEGEPTRVVIEGGPPLGNGPLAERRLRFQREFDSFRSFAVNEPRGYDALVGALLCEPVDKTCAAGVIYFNNVGYLGMCGHGTIGLAVTLAHLGRIGPGLHRFETPVGIVGVELRGRNEVTIENVASYRHLADVSVDVAGLGRITGDVAWGGNWFFLAKTTPHALEMANVGALTRAAEAVGKALADAGITGSDGAPVDHIEFFGPAAGPDGNSRNFVLCPGGAYDRSPCGTGTSAKVACLAAGGKLKPGERWVQESIVGSRFEAHYRVDGLGNVIPSLTGRAYVVSEATLLRDANDPFADGLRSDRG
ncbi:MAG: hydroxyproline-2-epimerase [Alphaproteobacteria bacterium]|nr:hydroxyproline-2-epimerase [Alphaproteobacteria bacterium]